MYRKVNKALKDQVDRLWHTTNIYLHPTIHEYGKKLASKFPGKLKVCSTTAECLLALQIFPLVSVCCVCVFVGVIEEKGREKGRKESDQTQTQ